MRENGCEYGKSGVSAHGLFLRQLRSVFRSKRYPAQISIETVRLISASSGPLNCSNNLRLEINEVRFRFLVSTREREVEIILAGQGESSFSATGETRKFFQKEEDPTR